MNISELLVTGYHGHDPLLVVRLVPEMATTVHTVIGEGQETTVESIAHQPTDAFAAVRDLLMELTVTGRASAAETRVAQ